MLLVFIGFGATSNLASKAMEVDGFENLGFYQNAVIYLMFGLFSFLGTATVNKIGNKWTLVVGSMCYFFNVIVDLLPSQYGEQIENREKYLYLNKDFIYTMILFCAAVNGMGAGIIWTAQGNYVSSCATDENKGFFFSYFYFIYMTSQVLGNLIAAFVLNNSKQSTFYMIMGGITLLGCLTFLLLTKPKMQQIQESIVNQQMRKMIPMSIFTGVSISIYSGSFVQLISQSLNDIDHESWSQNEKLALSLFAMVPLGIGELVGSVFMGPFIDKFGSKIAIVPCFALLVISYMLLFIFTLETNFSILVYFLTFTWGLLDSCINNLQSLCLFY
eukprot:403359690